MSTIGHYFKPKPTSGKENKKDSPSKRKANESPSTSGLSQDDILKKRIKMNENKAKVKLLAKKYKDSPFSELANFLFEESWKEKVAPEFEKGYFKELIEFLSLEEEKQATVFPPKHLVSVWFYVYSLAWCLSLSLSFDNRFTPLSFSRCALRRPT